MAFISRQQWTGLVTARLSHELQGHDPTRASLARSSTGSPSGPTSLRPGPPRTGSGPARASGRRDRQRPDQQPDRRSRNRSGVGPVLAITSPESGASSGCHTQAPPRHSLENALVLTTAAADGRNPPPSVGRVMCGAPTASGGSAAGSSTGQGIGAKKRCSTRTGQSATTKPTGHRGRSSDKPKG